VCSSYHNKHGNFGNYTYSNTDANHYNNSYANRLEGSSIYRYNTAHNRHSDRVDSQEEVVGEQMI